MSLTPGTKLGPYEILDLIGEGGMGEVYRARDTRLDRVVALKVSKQEFSERFEREARSVAALNHPNICALYDVGPNYLVMEFVEGEDLAGPLPVDIAVNYARQIAEALEAAHEKGIVHRDLKPANVKVTAAGTVKVLDFGLAKAVSQDPVSGSMRDSPTLSMEMTRAGMILGTAAYMSPEQAKGKPADRRADIWAFGVVLYEMLSGKRPYQGETASEIMAAVIKEEPNLSSMPAALRPLVARCLNKDPKQRLQAIGEARIALEHPAAMAATPAAPRPARSILWMAATAAFFLAALALAFVHFRETPPERRVLRFQVPAPEKSVPVMFRLSPDGRYMAFGSSDDNGGSRLWVRALDSVQAQSFAGTEGARYPFWSPDSATIGFFAQGKLKRIAVTGGAVQTICDAANGRGGSWNRDGVIVFSAGPNSPLQRVAATGGVASVLSASDPETSSRFPEFLPDGLHFLYLISSNKAENAGIYLGSLDGTARVRLNSAPSNAMYVPPAVPGQDGLLLFRREDTLMAQPFNAATTKTTGDLFPIVEQVGEAGNTGFGAFSVSATGVLAHAVGNGANLRELAWADRKGKRLQTVTKPGSIEGYALAPDEKRVVMSVNDKTQNDFWIQDLTRGTLSRLTFGTQSVTSALWSPDGARILYGAAPPSSFSYDLFQKAASGGKEDLVAHGGVNAFPSDWSRDGKFIVYSALSEKTNYDLWLLPVENSGSSPAGVSKPVVYLQTPFNETAARFSPDGRFMAYESDESGQYQVYVQTIPASGAKWQISTAGGRQPMWRADGKELYYVADQTLVAVPIRSDAAGFQAGTPEPLFDDVRVRDFANAYVPAAGGQRFLVRFAASGDLSAAPPVTVVLNWQTGVKR